MEIDKTSRSAPKVGLPTKEQQKSGKLKENNPKMKLNMIFKKAPGIDFKK